MPHVAMLSSLLAAVTAAALAAAAPASPTLGVRGDRFTVNGEPRFLVLVSYFDALDAKALDEDLAFIDGAADGIRVFANWWDWDARRDCQAAFSDRTVMAVGADGRVTLRPERLERLKAVLLAAGKAGLVVDLTLSYETVQGLSKLKAGPGGQVCGSSSDLKNQVRIDEYERGLVALAKALARPEFSHVFFDLQNEIGGGWTRLERADVRRLARAVGQADGRRLLSVSDFQPDPAAQVAVVKDAGLDLLTFHDFPRDAGWPERTGQLTRRYVEALRAAGLQVPIYAGEPPRDPGSLGAEAFETSLEAARRAGAAAWTFHTRAGFRLEEGRFESQLDAPGRTFLERRRSAARAGAGAAEPASVRVDFGGRLVPF